MALDLPQILAAHAKWLAAGCSGPGRANLGGADLRGADLRDAYLGGANLRDAGLGGADLRDAVGCICAGTDRRGYRFVGVRNDTGWMIAAGCRWFTIPEAIAHWATKGNRDALARIAVIQAHDGEAV